MRSFLRVLSVILLICWMAVIFFFSAQDATVSDTTSGKFIETIAEKVYPDFEELSPAEKVEFVEKYQFITRKAAHVAAYALLGILAFLTFISYVKMRFLARISWAGLISLAYAAGDEYHQSFVPGRGCEVRDFLIDAAGAIGAILLCTAFVKIFRSLRKKTAYVGFTKRELLRENYYLTKELKSAVANYQNLQNSLSDLREENEQLRAKSQEVVTDFSGEQIAPEFETFIEPIIEDETEINDIVIVPVEDVCLNSDEVLPIAVNDEQELSEEREPVLEEIPEKEEALVEEAPSQIVLSTPEKPRVAPQFSEETRFASSVIGEAVVEATKLCNKLTSFGADQTHKELVNLALGRTEVLKSEILKIMKLEITFEEKKNLIEKERRDTYDYFDSIMVQIS